MHDILGSIYKLKTETKDKEAAATVSQTTREGTIYITKEEENREKIDS